MDFAKLFRDVFTNRTRRNPGGDSPSPVGSGPLGFGDNVRIRAIPATEVLGIAGKVGQIYGETTPSITGLAVIGDLRRDYAINVYFAEFERSVWLAEELVEFVDHGPGTTMTIGDKTLVRRADGEWEARSE